MVQPPTAESATRRWPGLADAARRPADRFPYRVFIPWIMLGLAGLALLAGLFFYLDQRAAKRIIFLSPDRTFGVIRADGGAAAPLILPGVELVEAGPPQWSPRGGQFAGVVDDAEGTALLVAADGASAPSLTSLAEPVDPQQAALAWAPGGLHVAVSDSVAGWTALQIVDVAQTRSVTVALLLERAPIMWHPQRDELLVTAMNISGTSELQIVTTDGQARPFAPADDRVSRSQGAWSPDGQRLAYIATATLTDTTRLLSEGRRADASNALLVAGADGGAPSVIVPDGQNFLPIWAPRGDLIVFTRYISDTGEYQLFRVQPDGQGLQQIGYGLPPGLAARDMGSAVAWSPDGEQMFFQGIDPATGDVTLTVATYDGSNPLAIAAEPFSEGNWQSARWSPTSRAVLLASERGGIKLRWTGRPEAELFARGTRPSWEP